MHAATIGHDLGALKLRGSVAGMLVATGRLHRSGGGELRTTELPPRSSWPITTEQVWEQFRGTASAPDTVLPQ